MTVRFYLIPIERSTEGHRGPKYFEWRFDPDPPALVSGVSRYMMDYGLIDYALVCADVSNQQHNDLNAQADVGVIPTNLDANLTPSQVTAVQNRLEAANLPAQWVDTSYTWRQLIRIVTGIMLYMQRLCGIMDQNPFETGATLNTQVGNIPVSWRNAMQKAADDMALNYSSVTGTTTIRQLLKLMADQFEGRSFGYGFASL